MHPPHTDYHSKREGIPMAITDRVYRTATYLAGDWSGDKDAVTQMMTWNSGNKWGLHYTDVHCLTQSYDESLNCSIKASLRKRLNISKRFILIVGGNTDSLRSGACYNCYWYIKPSYALIGSCQLNHTFIDNRSYVQYECEMARKDHDDNLMDIVVLYNSVNVNRNLCPEPLRWVGTHAPMKKRLVDFLGNSHFEWDYESVKKAIG